MSFSLAVLVVLALRRPDALSTPQFWAEDGGVFFLDAFRCGISSFAYQYSGYLHTYPRLAAFIGAFFSHVYAPAIYELASTVPIFLICARIASPRLNVPDWARVAMLIPLALPPAAPEIIFRVTNAHWYLQLLFPLVLASSVPRTVKEAVADGAVLLLVASSTPATLTFMPIVALRLALSRAPRHALLCAAPAVLMTGVQFVTLINSGRLGVHGAPGDLIALSARAVGASLAGGPLTDAVLRYVPPTLVLALVAATMAGIVAMAYRSGRHSAAVFASLGALLWATTILAARHHPSIIVADRYHFGPVVMAVWAALLVQRSWLMALVVAMAVPLAHADGWRIPPVRDYDWRTASACLDDPRGCVIPIPPEGWLIDTHALVGKKQLVCGDRD